MDSAVIVCTRNRPEDVSRLLATFPMQDARPTLIVVDASDEGSTRQVVRAFERSGLWNDILYLESLPGLTAQRMHGVRNIPAGCDIVHFIDDDVELEPGYFSALERCFEEMPHIVGAGGVVTNVARPGPYLWNRIFFLDSVRQGAVLRSGVNVRALKVDSVKHVEWLSGCSMSFRAVLFQHVRFDTTMEGYGLGEDVDFSFRARRYGALVVCPAARLQHRELGASALDAREKAASELVRRHRFVRRYRAEGMSLGAYWWSVLGDLVLTAAKSVVLDRAVQLQKLRGLVDGIKIVVSAGDA